MKYGQEIHWRQGHGVTMHVESGWCESEEQAKKEAVELAKRFGWKPRRWWQFWRWGDTRLKALSALWLTLAATAFGNQDIPLTGNYDDTGYYRSEHILTMGQTYEISHRGSEQIRVVIMPGQNLGYVAGGQVVRFVAEGTWILLFSPFERGDKLKGWKLTWLTP